jgi:hypothetical protein
LEIHKPKAAHSLGEFAREMGAVVLGILIALALEQAVEAHHWSKRVEEGRAELRSEMTLQSRGWAYRLAVHSCAVRRMDEIEAILDDMEAGRTVPRVAPFARPFGAQMPRSVWQGLAAAGILSHMPPKEMLAFSDIYSRAEVATDWNRASDADWSTIQLIVGNPNRRSDADRSQIRVAINRERLLEYMWSLYSTQIEKARRLGAPKAATVQAPTAEVCQPLKRG